MTAAIARVRATYSNAGDHRENAANAAVAMVAIEPSTASHLSEVALCGAVSRYNETVLPPGPSSYFNLTPKRARMEGFIILDYVPRFPGAFEALGRWQSEGKTGAKEDVAVGVRFPEQIRAIAYMEAIVLPRRWEGFGEADGIFRALRSDKGGRMIFDDNFRSSVTAR
jgi:hypothetical protein